MKPWKIIFATILTFAALALSTTAQEDIRQKAKKLDKDGNYKEALALYQEPVSYTHLTLPTILLV